MAIQFTILTLVRTSEALNARMDEFDLDNGVWTMPYNLLQYVEDQLNR